MLKFFTPQTQDPSNYKLNINMMLKSEFFFREDFAKKVFASLFFLMVIHFTEWMKICFIITILHEYSRLILLCVSLFRFFFCFASLKKGSNAIYQKIAP